MWAFLNYGHSIGFLLVFLALGFVGVVLRVSWELLCMGWRKVTTGQASAPAPAVKVPPVVAATTPPPALPTPPSVHGVGRPVIGTVPKWVPRPDTLPSTHWPDGRARTTSEVADYWRQRREARTRPPKGSN
jgi:hypothetical protein